MGRKPIDSNPSRRATPTLLFLGLASSALAYMVILFLLRQPNSPSLPDSAATVSAESGGATDLERDNGGCCSGISNLELWGSAVKWGTEFKFNSSKECCEACKGLCSGNEGPCLCDSWVFCGNREACGSKFGECWLKKQKDALSPERQEAGNKIMWTSGLIFGKGQGIVGFETEHGTLHIKLYPDCAPHSVAYIIELLGLRHCAGCHFFRAEGRRSLWDANGNHIEDTSFGPPFALIQGTLEAQGTQFKSIPIEVCPTIRRGAVAWVGSGPEFFISLANHKEWNKAYTVFGYVLPSDMEIAEKFSELPVRSDVWNGINVSVLKNPISLRIQRVKNML